MDGIALSPSAPQQQAYILCADCGTPIPPNTANRCVNCLRNSVDITESIPKQAGLSFCRNCDRWLSPPQAWLIAELESRELLAICLRRLKGLKEVRLVDAGFIWTEPHSKRVRVKLTVQKEVRVYGWVHAFHTEVAKLSIHGSKSIYKYAYQYLSSSNLHIGLLIYSPSASLRSRVCRSIYSMSRLHTFSCKEHMESSRSSPTKSRP